MAYLREYQMAAGDPGLFSKLKKFKFGRFLGKAASIASFALPGAGALRLGGAALKLGKFGGLLGRLGGVGKRLKALGPLIGGGFAGGAGAGAGAELVRSFGGLLGGEAMEPMAEFGPRARPGRAPRGEVMGGFRRRRRLNVANVHALRRAIRRVGGFKKLAMKTISLTKTVRLKKRGRK